MHPSILSLATATPPHIYLQKEVCEKFIALFSINEEKAQSLRKMYDNSAIDKRHCVSGDFNYSRDKWDFWGSNFPETVPSTSQRNNLYKVEAPKLALEAAEKALKVWGGEARAITHVISVSCTGMMAPGIEFDLMRNLKLNPTVHRLGINFMGCFGAFKGLAVAKAFAKENPAHRILVVCTEICSIHLQTTMDADNILGKSIFSDGAAAAIVGMEPQNGEKALWEIVNQHTLGIENSLDLMTWDVGDTGFLMRLSDRVPVHIGRNIKDFVKQLVPQEISYDKCDWPIHPGGKSILQAIEKHLDLKKHQTLSSWNILANYGNMSSATFLFVLEHLAKQQERQPWAVGVAFGPGLSMEGILLKNSQQKV